MRHKYAEYAAHANYGNYLGQKWVSLALFSILSAQNIIIVHPTWFYPSSGMKNKSPESQYSGKKKKFFLLLLLMRFRRIDAHLMRIDANIGAWPTLIINLFTI